MSERSLAIIKPNGVAQNVIGDILKTFEDNNIKIVGLKMLRMSEEMAEEFYAVHKGKFFYETLVKFMVSGYIVAVVLEGADIIKRARELMGVTNPAEAKEGTIRHKYGKTVQQNAIHGSDSIESAMNEITFFFAKDELL